MKVLFIGNSHTYVHYVPLRVKTCFEKQGEKFEPVMLTHPGMGLDWHLQQSPTYFNLLYGNYDAVVLQHNAHPFPGKESLLKAGQAMQELIPAKTGTYLYMTWSEKNNPQGQQIMSEAYEELAALIGAEVCPVGRIWQEVQHTHDTQLYALDGEHSSVLGASLAAVVIAATLQGRSFSAEDYYDQAVKLSETEYDGRLIDMVIKDGEYMMLPLKDIK